MSFSIRLLQAIFKQMDRLSPEDPAALKSLDDIIDPDEPTTTSASVTPESLTPASGVYAKHGERSNTRLAS
jgi:hypothetical protein